MKDAEIIEMAMQAGFGPAAAWEEINGPIIAFARLIAEKQREEDASICDGLKHFFGYQCAAAIRKGGAA